MDELTLTIRIHDPKEKQDEQHSTVWVVIKVKREDLQLAPYLFAELYLAPAAEQLLAIRRP